MVNAVKYNGPFPDTSMPRGADVQNHVRLLRSEDSKAQLIVYKDENGKYLQGDGERGMLVIPPPKQWGRQYKLDGLGDFGLATAIDGKYPGCERIEREGYKALTLRGKALEYALAVFQSQGHRIFEAPIHSVDAEGKVNFNSSHITAILVNKASIA